MGHKPKKAGRDQIYLSTAAWRRPEVLMAKRWGILASCFLLLLFLLASCYLVSGERIETAPFEGTQAGLYAVTFVSSDGQINRTIDTGIPSAPFIVEVSAQTDQGELTVEILDLRGETAGTIVARLGVPDNGEATIRTDVDGLFTLRVTSIEARGGSYTVNYYLAAPLTPTPTSPPTPAP